MFSIARTLQRSLVPVAAASALGFLASTPGIAGSQPGSSRNAAPADSAVVATIGGQKITAAEIRALARGEFAEQEKSYRQQLLQLQNTNAHSQDKLLRQKLSDYLDRRALELESAASGKSTTELLAAVPVREVTDDEARALYDRYKDRTNESYEEAQPTIRNFLALRLKDEATRAYYRELRDRHQLAVVLEPFRVQVADTGPMRGNPGARVTVVEFADFQCPFCSQAEATVKAVLARHPDDVRVVFRHLPLESLHPNAMIAARAGVCAERQGKFWEMHDAMFANQSKLTEPALKETAKQLGIDADKFGDCLADAATAAAVSADLDAAAELGIGGTPAFFVNGRPLEGSMPEADFEAVIVDELNRARRNRS